jgi:hypothetical protein
MLGVFVLNVYIGLYDNIIRSVNVTHWYLNWLIAVVDIVAAAILFLKPLSTMWIALAGIGWPVVYVLSLGVDVYTKLCVGAPASTASTCASYWPTHTSAFDYLIVNSKSAFWPLFQGTVPLIIVLLFLVFLFSIVGVYNERRLQQLRMQAATGGTRPSPPPPSSPP